MRTIKPQVRKAESEVPSPRSEGWCIGARTSAPRVSSCVSGQALLETLLIFPMLLLIVFNAINFGYFFLVCVNLAAAPRSGVEYSILGAATPGILQLPNAGPSTTNTSISYLAYQDMTGALYQPSNATVQVCTDTLGFANNSLGSSNQTTNCASYGSGQSWTPASDPESPSFVLNRVDVQYTFTPLIPGTPFGASLLPAAACTSSGPLGGMGGGSGSDPGLPPPNGWALWSVGIWAFVLMVLTGLRVWAGRSRRPVLGFAFALCLVLLWSSCGGGCHGGGGTISCTIHRQVSMRAMD